MQNCQNITDISLVIACYNSGSILDRTLIENCKLPFGEILLVDGGSADHTEQVVARCSEKMNRKIPLHRCPKKGLANARNIGTNLSQSAIVLHAGPDNFFTREGLEAMLLLLNRYDLVSCQTRHADQSRYFERIQDLYKRRLKPGLQEVVGTPYLGRRELFEQFPFNERMLNSDDTELCRGAQKNLPI